MLNPYYLPDRMQEYELDFSLLSLTANDLFAEMGYGNTQPEEPVEALAVSMLEEVSSWIVPRCTFGLFDGRIEGDTVFMTGGESFLVGATISFLLKGSRRFALFAATAGTAFQEYQNRLKTEDDILKSFIADILGTCVAEKAGDYMERLLEKELAGERHTNRLSPGYCGWHLSGQQTLFRLMGGTPCGISLSEVCLMTPIKSISGIIGIGPDVDEKKYGCQYCELETCYKRKRKKK
ncbi:hypothetical protein M1P97_21465 [Parabacteroides sp. GYB001]|uniref:vitamin B12 dependent-methionine synthase activation domain-containing protein n=1 Tax=Parabacteroides leei TaxID=2939491 RepID=UPI002017CFF7|nr:vitamin B12 dependent-methionine synthase activation domain-containing protein [Parabacteroides leei]MCL3853860.1 hypothetical protein [Parabacteroides leei]